jgi:hypothetical protein
MLCESVHYSLLKCILVWFWSFSFVLLFIGSKSKSFFLWKWMRPFILSHLSTFVIYIFLYIISRKISTFRSLSY